MERRGESERKKVRRVMGGWVNEECGGFGAGGSKNPVPFASLISKADKTSHRWKRRLGS
jgi:ribosomal protein L37AE/L43A